jgi:hypothetical protein
MRAFELPASEQQRTRHRVDKTPIYPGKPGPGDAFAPAPASCVCTDLAGYQRPRHAFDNDGRCIFCSARSDS